MKSYIQSPRPTYVEEHLQEIYELLGLDSKLRHHRRALTVSEKAQARGARKRFKDFRLTHIGIMENRMETTILYSVGLGFRA